MNEFSDLIPVSGRNPDTRNPFFAMDLHHSPASVRANLALSIIAATSVRFVPILGRDFSVRSMGDDAVMYVLSHRMYNQLGAFGDTIVRRWTIPNFGRSDSELDSYFGLARASI